MTPYQTWEDGSCAYCWARQDEVCDVYDDDTGEREPFFRFDCPTCGREGCPECMPAGRGVDCPECEEGLDEVPL